MKNIVPHQLLNLTMREVPATETFLFNTYKNNGQSPNIN